MINKKGACYMRRLLGLNLLLFVFMSLFTGCAQNDYFDNSKASPSWSSSVETQQKADEKFNLICALPEDEIYLYAISNERQPPALALFRNEETFILYWECDTYSDVYQIMLKKDSSGNDQLYISLSPGRGSGMFLTDLHVLTFSTNEGNETIFSEHSLKGAEFSDWFTEPIVLKGPIQGNKGIIFFDGKEYAFSPPKTTEFTQPMQGIHLWPRNEFYFEQGDITLRNSISAVYNEISPYEFGNIVAKVHFDGENFSFSDYEFVVNQINITE